MHFLVTIRSRREQRREIRIIVIIFKISSPFSNIHATIRNKNTQNAVAAIQEVQTADSEENAREQRPKKY